MGSTKNDDLAAEVERLNTQVDQLQAYIGSLFGSGFTRPVLRNIRLEQGAVTIDQQGITLEEGGIASDLQDGEIKWHRSTDASTVYKNVIRTNPDGSNNPYLELFSGSTAALTSASGVDTYAYANPTSGTDPFYVATLMYSDDSSGAELYSMYTGYAFPGTGAKVFGLVKGNENTEAFLVLNPVSTVAITGVEEGLMYKNTATSQLLWYLGGGWRTISSW